MRKRNTHRHWTALTIARYYDKFGEACRVRDLYPYVDTLWDTPDKLVSAVSHVRHDDVDHISVNSPTSRGGVTKAFAYYPTEETIEFLDRLGEPDELPGGGPIPDGVDTTIPDTYVAADEEPEPPSDDKSTGLHYELMQSYETNSSSSVTRTYDTTHISGEPDVSLVSDDADERDDGVAEDDPDHTEPTEPLRTQSEPSDGKPIETDTGFPVFDGEDGVSPNQSATDTDVDWNNISLRLGRKADKAEQNDMTEVATAYHQFSTLAVEGRLDKRTAFILLGTPVLEFEVAQPTGYEV